MGECTHTNKHWIPAEEDTNVRENLICLDCNKNLSLEMEGEDG